MNARELREVEVEGDNRDEHNGELYDHTVELDASDVPATHCLSHVVDEPLTVLAQVLRGIWMQTAMRPGKTQGTVWGHTLVQRIIRVGLEEEVLEADHDRVEVEHRLPVLSQNVQADVALEVYVRVVDLWRRQSQPRGWRKEHAKDARFGCT